MRGLIGCAAVIAVVAFFLGLIGALFVVEASLAERLGIAMLPAAMAFIAAILLGTRDYARSEVTKHRVQKMLLVRIDVTDADFVASFPAFNADLVLQTREAISEFFGVPSSKIHPSDKLSGNLKVDLRKPSFHSYVIYRVFNLRHLTPQPYVFHSTKPMDIGDLIAEIQRVLNSFGSGTSSGG
jgi:hypothetical protein